MADACAVPYCLAAPLPGLFVCLWHRDAARVDELGLKDRKCPVCQHTLKGSDWVWRKAELHTSDHRHVNCSPALPRSTQRYKRDAPTPLLDEKS